MTMKELFEFVTDANITDDNMDEYLEEAMKLASSRSHEELTAQEKVDEEVNHFSYF